MSDRLGSAHVPTKAGSPPEASPGGMPEKPVLHSDGHAELAACLEADRELRDTLAAQDFTGDAYAVFEDELAGYGHQLMMAWLASGHIFTRCRQAGLRLLSLPIPFSDREDLAQETVADALRTFKRKGLEQGGWRPEGGASLKAHFAGALLRQFANTWKKGSEPLPPPARCRLIPCRPIPSRSGPVRGRTATRTATGRRTW